MKKNEYTQLKKSKTLHSEYVYKTSFGSLRKDKCQLPNGFIIDEYYVNEYSDWVNAIVLTKENQLVLVEQYRYAGNDLFVEIPAGKIESGETNEVGIIREVREETGYVSDSKPIKLGEYMINPATQNNKIITYLIQDAYKAFEQQLEDTEEIKIKLVNFDEMGELLKNSQMNTQLFTESAYLMAKEYISSSLKGDY